MISKRVRFDVLKRDGFQCLYCGRKPPEVVLEVDHIIPRCKGGKDSMVNLLSSCQDCNRGKSGIPLNCIPNAYLPSLEERKKRIIQLTELAKVSISEQDVILATLKEIHKFWKRLDKEQKDDSIHVPEFIKSTRTFLRYLPPTEITDSIAKAFTSGVPSYRRFRYYCGVCWRKIKEGTKSPQQSNDTQAEIQRLEPNG